LQQGAAQSVSLAERKLAAAHKALLDTRGLQLDFKAVEPPKPPPGWTRYLVEAIQFILPVLKYVFWAGLIAGAGLILWMIVAEIADSRDPKKRSKAAPVDWRPTEQAARTLLEDADRLAAEGRFAEAIHLLLFRSIEDLSGRRPGLVRPALTSRDIAGLEVLPPDARGAFARIAAAVERSFFAARPVDADDFASCRGDYEAFAFAKSWS
jgi:hypothetical protein